MDVLSAALILAYDVLGTALQALWVFLFTGVWYGKDVAAVFFYNASILWG